MVIPGLFLLPLDSFVRFLPHSYLSSQIARMLLASSKTNEQSSLSERESINESQERIKDKTTL